MVFENRQEAGKKLAAKLLKYRDKNPYILSIPRGGVPIGFEVAEVLQAPLSVIVVRKIGLSSNPEFGIGAIVEGGVKVLDVTAANALGINQDVLDSTLRLEGQELKRRVKVYRDNQPLPRLRGKTVILVDDGMATGVTAKAAIKAIVKLNPGKIVLATPVCALDTVESLKRLVDEVVCLATPIEFMAVGTWYRNFNQVTDEEVKELLQKANERLNASVGFLTKF